MMLLEKYHVTLCITDNEDVRRTKRQFAKRQCFAALNTQMTEDTTYMLKARAHEWRLVCDQSGDSVYTYLIVAIPTAELNR